MSKQGNLIIDGTQLLMANLAVNDDYYTNDGDYLGGMMGLIAQVGGLINMFQPYSVFITFDEYKSKFRLELLPDYKAGRHAKLSDELRKKFEYRWLHTSYLKEIFPMLGVHVLVYPDVEADDVIANFVNQSGRLNTIVSTDKDYLQLVGPLTRVYRPIRKPILVDNNNIEEILGFDPILYLKIRTLEGDSSDNIKGVNGVAKKTALKIFETAGSSEPNDILTWAKEECKYKYKDSLIEFLESNKWELNMKLMDFKYSPNIPIKDLITPLEFNYDNVFDFLLELKVDDFMFEEDIHRTLYNYEELH